MDWQPIITEITPLANIAIAMLFGGLIGLEREQARKPAGFRTHTLVAAAAALLVSLANALLLQFGTNVQAEHVQSDPIRVVEAIITGISFLGAGTIFRSGDGEMVQGLTTAASLLLVAAIGIAVALGSYYLAAGVTLLALIVLRALQWVSGKIGRE